MKTKLFELSDEMLMQEYQLGEVDAFSELFRRHGGKIYGYLRQRVKGNAHIEDLFQETFFRVHKYRDKYNPSCPFVPWLFTLCRNIMIDAARKDTTQRRTEASLLNVSETNEVKQLAWADGGEKIVQFEMYLKALSKKEKDILFLRYEEELSFKEVASRLRMTSSNARKLSSRALQKLRAVFLSGKENE